MGLDTEAALALAQAVATGAAGAITSFSISYNPVGDEGCLVLVAALPSSIGMVGCSVSDVCAEAWLQWARSPARSPNLYMLCIEENSYSASMRARLDTSGLALPILLTEALNSTP